MNNVLKGIWVSPALCLNKMMKSLMKAYLHGKTNELAEPLEGQVAQGIHTCFLRQDCSEPLPVGKYWNMKWEGSLHPTACIFRWV